VPGLALPVNKLYFGDNLDMLRAHIKDESVDLVYLDPPFNSSATYNVLFKESAGVPSEAQAEAFRDTWGWGESAAIAYDEIDRAQGDAAVLLRALRSWLGQSAMLAYLCMMTVRLQELKRVLKPEGSIYLHCDATASHYLRLMMDCIFGPNNFRSEIIWKRATAHSDAITKFATVSDTILFYSASPDAKFNVIREPLSEEYKKKFYKHIDADGRRFQLDNIAAPEGGGMSAINKKTGKPNGWYVWKGYEPPARGWRYSPETMAKLDAEGRLYYPEDFTQRIRLKRFLDENKGQVVSNLWTDIAPLNAASKEALGYPTQKPVSLLKRILSASSNKDSVVLDPFCGCGTTIEAAQELNRQWIGIDVTHYAVTLIETRLEKLDSKSQYEVDGRPKDYAGAIDLARRDKYQFQWWAAWLLGAQTYQSKKGGDRGIDGNIYYANGPYGHGRIIISVKGGENLYPSMVRDLSGVVQREPDANMGILVTLNEPSRGMSADAAAAGFVEKSAHGRLPRIQIVTVADLLDGRFPKMPPLPEPVRSAPRSTAARNRDQLELFLPLVGIGPTTKEGEIIDPRFLRFGSANETSR
jgi:adenine specific DNA methylase Mod